MNTKKIIISSIGKHTFITDTDGFCITSSNAAKIGRQINLPQDLQLGLKSHVTIINGQRQIIIPLRLNRKTIAFLFLDESYGKLKKHMILAKNLAELFIRQYFESNKPSTDHTDSFITRLVNGNAPITDLEIESQPLGYDFSQRRVAIVCAIPNFDVKYLIPASTDTLEHEETIRKWKHKIESAINGFFTANKDIITAYIGENKFVAFKAIGETDFERFNYHMKKSYQSIFGTLQQTTAYQVAIGYSDIHEGLNGLRRGFYEADMAVALGPKILPQNPAHYFGDLGILQILAEKSQDRRARLVHNILDQLDDSDLNKTLETFFEENLNLAQTAKTLGVHRNTAIYRLNQISSILSLDPRRFHDAVTLQIALLIKKYLS